MGIVIVVLSLLLVAVSVAYGHKLYRSFQHVVSSGRVTENLYAVKMATGMGAVNLFIYRDDENAICIDSGYAGHRLEDELKRINIRPESVSHVFLTHTDFDHAGGIGLFGNARIYLAKDEEQMINGTTPRLLWFYHNPRINREYNLLRDGDIINVGKIKVRAIATPGHTLGSMSFLIDDYMLFTGDTLALRKGKVHTNYRLVNMNTATQRASIRRLAALENVSILCTGHTGCSKEYEDAMKQWRE